VAKNEDDVNESIHAMMALKKELKTPVTHLATGSSGLLSRIVNPILGAHIAFCVDQYRDSSFVNQPQIRAMRDIIDNVKRNV
jgi:3-dehydroquinate dehydratase